MNLDSFLDDLPLLHSWDGGKTWNTGGFSREHLAPMLAFFREHAPARPTILETGAGNSSIAFLHLEPSSLISICPEKELFDRIGAYCSRHKIDVRPWTRYVDGSEWALPRLAELSRTSEPSVDIALIDGCHNYPMVFVDFHYVHYLLKTGGYLVVDDLQLHTAKELAKLLAEGSEYEAVLDLGKAVVFRKVIDARTMPEWNVEAYVLRKTEEYAKLPNPFSLT